MEQFFITETQQKSIRRILEHKMKVNDIISVCIGISGLVLAFYECELFYGIVKWEVQEDGSFKKSVEKEQYIEDSTNTALRVLIGLSSLVLCALLYNHYRLKLFLSKAKQKVDSNDTLRSAGYLWRLSLELFFCMIHTPPGLNYVFEFEQHGGSVEYSVDMLVATVMLGRIYLLWRVFTSYSVWNDETAEDICNSCLCEGGVNFAVKAELKERPYTVVSVVLLVSISAFGMALRNAERPFMGTSEMDWDYVWNGMWCMIITMTTVGFGDYYPSTHLGRMIGVLGCFWGIFLVSLMVVSLTISSEFTPQERNAFNKIMRDEGEDRLRDKAANAIKSAIRLKIFLKYNYRNSEKKKAVVVNKFKKALIEYRTHKRSIQATEHDAPIEHILAKLNDKVAMGLDKIKKDCYVYRTLLARLDTAETNQAMIASDVDLLYGLNHNVLSKLAQIKQSR